MKLQYVANVRMPTEKAHGLQITKMCEAYVQANNEVELVVPNMANHITDDFFEYYGIKKIFTMTRLATLSGKQPLLRFSYYVEEIVFLRQLSHFFKKKNEVCKVITRDIFFTLFFGDKHDVFYEMHDFPLKHTWLWRRALNKARGVIVTNKWKKAEVMKRFGVPEENILVAPNGFDPVLFSPQAKSISRRSLGIPTDSQVLCYAGMFKTMGEDKGVGFLIKAMSTLPDNVVLLLVGGSEADVSEFSTLAEQTGVGDRVCFVGRVPYNHIAQYLQVADVFVAPFPDTPHYRYYMSPIKLFEYMAMGKPVIATNLPSIVEVLGDIATLIEPDSQLGFCEAVKSLKHDEIAGRELGDQMLQRSAAYTWGKRARLIVDFITRV